eukprot:g1812.t1
MRRLRSRRSELETGCVFYEGHIVHIRRHPVFHEFTYPLRLALVDLDEPPNWFLGQSADHWTSEECRRKAGTDGKVKLLTSPACCGYIQNPTSIYYCYSSTNTLEKCIAEMTNTPYGSRVWYLFNPKGDRFCKALQVSPFMGMDLEWKFKSDVNDERLSVSIRCCHPVHGDFFDAILNLKPSKNGNNLNERSGFRVLWKYGLQPQKVACWIYWQCICLFSKGVPISMCPRLQKIKTNVEAQTKDLKFTTGEGFIWKDPQSYPFSVYA